MTGLAGHHVDERGYAAIEAMFYMVVLMTMVSFMVYAGRYALARKAVEYVAWEAARTATLERNAGSARTAATQAGSASLRNQDLQCVSSSVTLDTSGFSVPLGQPAEVSATVTCTMDNSFLLPVVPGQMTVRATKTSSLDQWRPR